MFYIHLIFKFIVLIVYKSRVNTLYMRHYRRERFHRDHRFIVTKNCICIFGVLAATVLILLSLFIGFYVQRFSLVTDCPTNCTGHTQCTISICKDGACVDEPVNKTCDDGLSCTYDDTCVAGTCVGTVEPCWDNNPCTYNKCVEGTGCMLQHQDHGTCNTTCTKDDQCPGIYTCVDGTCILLDESGSTIRFLDYTLDNCPEGKRLIMDFVLDTIPYTLNNETRYILPKSIYDFVSDGYQPLGFIDDITNLNNVELEGIVRTGFSLSTECQVFTETNCDTLFSLRSYNFFINLHHCLSVHNHNFCLDAVTNTAVYIDLDIHDCTDFVQRQHLEWSGETVVFNGTREMVPPIFLPSTIDRITAGFRTDLYENSVIRAVTTGFRICSPKLNHRLKPCVLGDPICGRKGCYYWDPEDYPIELFYDIVSDGITPFAKSDWGVASCYDESVYLNNTCSGNKCPNTVTGLSLPWAAPMDDGFLFKTDLLRNRVWTFDFRFKMYVCNGGVVDDREYHNILTINT